MDVNLCYLPKTTCSCTRKHCREDRVNYTSSLIRTYLFSCGGATSDYSLLQFEIIDSIKLLATIEKNPNQKGSVKFTSSALSERKMAKASD